MKIDLCEDCGSPLIGNGKCPNAYYDKLKFPEFTNKGWGLVGNMIWNLTPNPFKKSATTPSKAKKKGIE